MLESFLRRCSKLEAVKNDPCFLRFLEGRMTWVSLGSCALLISGDDGQSEEMFREWFLKETELVLLKGGIHCNLSYFAHPSSSSSLLTYFSPQSINSMRSKLLLLSFIYQRTFSELPSQTQPPQLDNFPTPHFHYPLVPSYSRFHPPPLQSLYHYPQMLLCLNLLLNPKSQIKDSWIQKPSPIVSPHI